ncbi:hypothetical protein C2E23DRAFT_860602 [Lenzites betulinus]|nr:hypothetical protein C2E23DRAFT_860602 [Lenzites betulinus]
MPTTSIFANAHGYVCENIQAVNGLLAPSLIVTKILCKCPINVAVLLEGYRFRPGETSVQRPKRLRTPSPPSPQDISRPRLSFSPVSNTATRQEQDNHYIHAEIAPNEQAARSHDDLEDMYADIRPIAAQAGLPPMPMPDNSPPRSPTDENRQLGLYDDPNDLDLLQLSLGECATDNEDDSPDVPAGAPGGSPRLSPQPQLPSDEPRRPSSPAGAAPDARDVAEPNTQYVAIPGMSPQEHPALAHILDLPPIPLSISPHTVYAECHPLWYVRITLLLAAYLHTHHHVTFRAADLVLSTLRTLFVALDLIDTHDPMPRTLTTTLKRLDLTDKFYILIECVSCRQLFKPNIKNYRLQCFQCKIPLFTTTSRTLLARLLRRDAPIPIPRTVAPLRLLSSALAYLIGQPGIESYLEAWTTRPAPPVGEYRSIQDGSRWKTLMGADDKAFFGLDHGEELQVPVILHVDWFSAASSAFSASYSSGVISFSLPTLPPALRYRVEYLILTAMTDGPKEPNAEELQHWMALIVDDLLMLYHQGIMGPTPSYPQGESMCKVGGFADKSHNEVPCTEGTVTSKEMYSDECLRGGVVKTQWYTRWIQAGVLRADTKAGTKRELAVMHAFLDTFEVPGWVGRLPLRVGEPAGGSLSADEYKHLMIGPGCIILPLIWHHFKADIKEEHNKAMKKYTQAQRIRKNTADKRVADMADLEAKLQDADALQKPKLSKKLATLRDQQPDEPMSEPTPRMRPGEVRLILQLATALKLLLAPMYGVESMVPNHHFASHIPAQLEEFATVYEIWAFLAERLNKTLKGTNLNNRRGGQQEVTMMRAYHHDIALRSIVDHVSSAPAADTIAEQATRTIAQRFGHNSREARGTVEAAATSQADANDVRFDALMTPSMHYGPKSAHPKVLLPERRQGVLDFYNNLQDVSRGLHAHARIYNRNDHHAPHDAIFLDTAVYTLRFVVVNDRRITPGTSAAIVKTGFSTPQIFAEMSWMVPTQSTSVAGDPWKDFPELDIRYFNYQERAASYGEASPLIIPASEIVCQLARGVCTVTTPRLWITTTLDKVPISMEVLAGDIDVTEQAA